MVGGPGGLVQHHGRPLKPALPGRQWEEGFPETVTLELRYTPSKTNPFVGELEMIGPLHIRGLCHMLLDMGREILLKSAISPDTANISLKRGAPGA